MGAIGAILASSCDMSVNYAERLLPGIAAEDFAKFARNGDKPIVSNHPAFVYGHFSIYPIKVLSLLELSLIHI